MNKLNRIVLLIAVLLAFFLVCGGSKIFHFSETKKEYNYLALFSEIVTTIKSDYVEEIQPGEKFPGAFSGMLKALDKMCSYLDTHKTGIYRLYQQGTAYSCGIYGAKQANYFLITDIVPHSPAELCGLKPGDTIRAINGKSIYRQSFWETYLELLSEKEETLEILLLQDKDPSASANKIQLKTAYIPSTLSIKKIDRHTCLVELPRIDTANVTQLKLQLEKENSQNNPLKLVVDLRKYSGGDTDAFIQLTQLFFPDTLAITLKTKTGEEKLTLGSKQPLSYQAVVIINKSTRMYGELLAALFKKYNTGNVTLMGTKTRGFIAKLKQFPLRDGSSILLTEGVFLIDGKNPAEKGITPDVKISKKEFAAIIHRATALLTDTHD